MGWCSSPLCIQSSGQAEAPEGRASPVRTSCPIVLWELAVAADLVVPRGYVLVLRGSLWMRRLFGGGGGGGGGGGRRPPAWECDQRDPIDGTGVLKVPPWTPWEHTVNTRRRESDEQRARRCKSTAVASLGIASLASRATNDGTQPEKYWTLERPCDADLVLQRDLVQRQRYMQSAAGDWR